MLVLVALAIASRAGVWAVSYSGGTFTVTGEQCTTGHPKPYAAYQGGWGGGGTTGVCPNHNPPPPAGAGTVVCQGAVTVTFTWVPQGPGNTVPSVVVLRKEATANWSGGNSGSCDNGLGDPEVSGVSTGVDFEVVQNPASPIVRTITPGANVTMPAPPPTTDVGSASVVVKFSAIVPTLSLAGTKLSQVGDETYENILVGQRLTAEVQTGGLPQGTQDTFSWTVPAGSPFNGYTTTDTFGQYSGFAPSNMATAGWHFAKGKFGNPEAIGVTECLVSCNVVLREPEPDLAFTVSRHVRIFEPEVQAPMTLTIGTVQMFWNPVSPQSLLLIGLPWPNGSEVGAIWSSRLLRIPFVDQPGQPNGQGKWGVFQLVNAKLNWQRTGQPLRKNAHYGLWGLDSGVPYLRENYEFELDGIDHAGSDTPGIKGALQDPLTEWASIDFAFITELMFRPPGSSSVWVPLQAPKWWYAIGTATKVPPWTLTGNSQGLSPGQIPIRVFLNWERGFLPPINWEPPH